MKKKAKKSVRPETIVVEIVSAAYKNLTCRAGTYDTEAKEQLEKFGFVQVVEEPSSGRMVGKPSSTNGATFFLDLGEGIGHTRTFSLFKSFGTVRHELDSGGTMMIFDSTPGCPAEVTATSGHFEWVFTCKALGPTTVVPPKVVKESVDMSTLPPKAHPTEDSVPLLKAIVEAVSKQPECEGVEFKLLQDGGHKGENFRLARLAIAHVACHVFGQSNRFVSPFLGQITSLGAYAACEKARKEYVTNSEFRELVGRVSALIPDTLLPKRK
jgi:hypothetical protein